jgi:hypothetical protein
MAAYKDLVGQKITKVTSDPSEAKTGQMWYNSTTGTLRGLETTTAWVSEGTYFNKVFGVALGGPIDAAVGAGGYAPPGPSNSSVAGEYNGNSWTSIPGLNTARGSLGSSKQGSQTAFWVAGGSSQTGATEEWNGSTWSEDGDLNTGRRLSGSAGTLTAGLAFGGYASPAGTANSEEYNGTSWSEGNNLGASIYYNTGFGSQTAAISGGGNTGSPDTGLQSAYEYDGTSWTGLTDIGYGFQQGGGHGNTSEGFVYGGSGSPSTYINSTAEWSGSAWSTIPQTLPAPSRAWNGTGPGTSGLQLGGSSPSLPGGTTNTNAFVRSAIQPVSAAWASGGNLNTGRLNVSMGGTQTAGIVLGGHTSPGAEPKAVETYNGSAFSSATAIGPYSGDYAAYAGSSTAGIIFGGAPYTTSTAEYNGSWTGGGALSTGRSQLMGAGTGETSAVAIGGFTDSTTTTTATEEYGGTSWTAGGSMSTQRGRGAGFGIETAALVVGGSTSPDTTLTANSEEYGGTSWTSGGSLFAATSSFLGGWGTQTDGAIVGGGTPGYVNTTLGYDGTSWSTRPNAAYAAGRTQTAGADGSAGLRAGGGPNTSQRDGSEEFTGATTSTNIGNFSTS